MLSLLGYGQVSLSDPNAGKPESGVDVLARLADRRIGFQVREYYSDVDQTAGPGEFICDVKSLEKQRLVCQTQDSSNQSQCQH